MDNELLCNFKKCRKVLNSHAWVTSCSHVFCNEDGAREFEKGFICPACETPLSGRYDAVHVDLNPSEQYKSMVLAGQKPDTVLDISTRAITFWIYQVHQEIVYQEYIYRKAKERQVQLEKYYENVLQKIKNELEQVKGELKVTKQELEASQKKVAELTEKLTEQNRLYKKLQRVNDSLQRKFVTPMYFEEQATSKRRVNMPQNTIGLTSANDIFQRKNLREKGNDYSEAERDFVLRPVSTPLVQATSQNLFNFMPQNATKR